MGYYFTQGVINKREEIRSKNQPLVQIQPPQKTSEHMSRKIVDSLMTSVKEKLHDNNPAKHAHKTGVIVLDKIDDFVHKDKDKANIYTFPNMSRSGALSARNSREGSRRHDGN